MCGSATTWSVAPIFPADSTAATPATCRCAGIRWWSCAVVALVAAACLPVAGVTAHQVVSELAAGRLQVVIAERIPMAEAERAHEISRGGKVVGKLELVA